MMEVAILVWDLLAALVFCRRASRTSRTPDPTTQTEDFRSNRPFLCNLLEDSSSTVVKLDLLVACVPAQLCRHSQFFSQAKS